MPPHAPYARTRAYTRVREASADRAMDACCHMGKCCALVLTTPDPGRVPIKMLASVPLHPDTCRLEDDFILVSLDQSAN